jgi:hypothetical protein
MNKYYDKYFEVVLELNERNSNAQCATERESDICFKTMKKYKHDIFDIL